MDLPLASYDRLLSLKGETLWVVDLTASSALDAIAHSSL
jgi:hypothetical protein